jgi:hypothetical protein
MAARCACAAAGIRIEANFMPGAGNLDRIKDAPLTPVG